MNKSKNNSERIKSQIIIHVLDFIEHGEKEYRKQATEKIHEFAKFYTVPLKRKAMNPEIKEHLRKFILNIEGYMTTIPNLYNSLNN
jgi:hypothetical protein